MKSLIITLLFLSQNLFSQDTLRHILPGEPLHKYPALNLFGDTCAYLSGQNCLGYEKFAERFIINGQGTITGIEVYLDANLKNPNRSLAFDIYSVKDNGMPGDTLGRYLISYRNLGANTDAIYVNFDSTIKVNKTFFVGINFLKYAHESLTDIITILTSANGTRPSSDLIVKGRNVVQVHHGQFEEYSQRTDQKVFFALSPIGSLKKGEDILRDNLTSVRNSDISTLSIYPSPTSDILYISFQNKIPELELIEIANISLQRTVTNSIVQNNKTLGLNIENLQSGIYFLMIKTSEGIISKPFSVVK